MQDQIRNTGQDQTAPAPDDTRRRFIKAGFIAAPLVITLSARPAWATSTTTGSLGNYGSATNG